MSFLPGNIDFQTGIIGVQPNNLGILPGNLCILPGNLCNLPGNLGVLPGNLGLLPYNKIVLHLLAGRPICFANSRDFKFGRGMNCLFKMFLEKTKKICCQYDEKRKK